MILAQPGFTLIHGKNNCLSFTDRLLTLLDHIWAWLSLATSLKVTYPLATMSTINSLHFRPLDGDARDL